MLLSLLFLVRIGGKNVTMPRNSCSCLMVVGVGNFLMALTFDGRGDAPSLEILCPKNSTSSTPVMHFEGLTTIPLSLSLLRTCCRPCRCWPGELENMSVMYVTGAEW